MAVSSQQQNDDFKRLDKGNSFENSGAGKDFGDGESGLPKSSDSIDAREFLKDLRMKAQESLVEESPPYGGSDERDVEYMVKLVHGLIKINQEIWGRCEDRMAPPYPTNFRIEEAEQGNARMMRFSYDEAVVSASAEKVSITVKKSLHYKDFGPPPSIPSSLTELVVLRPSQERSNRQILHDYLGYIGRAGLLEDNVLLSFLQKLQTHLEDIQCYVGEIEKWLTERIPIVDFLNNLFEKELHLGSTSNEWTDSSD
eukprot:8435_1